MTPGDLDSLQVIDLDEQEDIARNSDLTDDDTASLFVNVDMEENLSDSISISTLEPSQKLSSTAPTNVFSFDRIANVIHSFDETLLAENVSDSEVDTVHSQLDTDTLEIPISEQALNYSKYQICFRQHTMPSNVEIQKLFQNSRNEKTRLWISLNKNTFETDVSKILCEHLNPSNKYRMHFFPDVLYTKLTPVLQNTFKNLRLEKTNRFLEDIENVDEQMTVMSNYHEGKTNHRGVIETENHLTRKYYWPNMRKSISIFLANCDICNRAKYDRNPYKIPLEKTPTAFKPFEILHLDLSRFLVIHF